MIKKGFLFILLSLLFALPVKADSNIQDEPADVYIIPINGDIDRPLTVFIRRSLDEADRLGAGTVIFEINTFGGLVESALQITTLIGNSKAETIAYIPAIPESTGVSWSAGALISFSCSRIYMAPGTSIGAAAPVYQGAEGMQPAEEKTVSAVRTQMAALAEKNGYPKAAALGMVDLDSEIIEVEVNGKLSLAEAGEIDYLKQRTLESGGTFKTGRTVSPSGKLLALTANEMLRYGISSGLADSRSDLLLQLGLSNAAVAEAESTMPDRIITLFTGGALTTILIILGLGAIYLEITSPGFGIPGTIAIIIFLIIFVSNGMLGYVGSLEILLFIAGLALLVVEIFLIPGFGAAGVSGILLIGASLLLSRQGFILPEFEWQTELLKKNLLVVGGGIFGSIILLAVLIQIFPRLGFFNRLILQSSQLSTDGFTVQDAEPSGEMIGKTGIAQTVLRPSGKAVFGAEAIVVESEGEYIEQGSRVEIIRADSNRLIVRKTGKEA